MAQKKFSQGFIRPPMDAKYIGQTFTFDQTLTAMPEDIIYPHPQTYMWEEEDPEHMFKEQKFAEPIFVMKDEDRDKPLEKALFREIQKPVYMSLDEAIQAALVHISEKCNNVPELEAGWYNLLVMSLIDIQKELKKKEEEKAKKKQLDEIGYIVESDWSKYTVEIKEVAKGVKTTDDQKYCDTMESALYFQQHSLEMMKNSIEAQYKPGDILYDEVCALDVLDRIGYELLDVERERQKQEKSC